MRNTPWFVYFVNITVPWGEVLIGLGLLFGALTRFAAFGAGRILGLDAYIEQYEIGGVR